MKQETGSRRKKTGSINGKKLVMLSLLAAAAAVLYLFLNVNMKYFSYAIPIIGDVKLKTPPAPEPTGSSSSGCNAAPWNLLISLCAAFLCFKKYKG